MKLQASSFTTFSDGLMNRLINDVGIGKPFTPPLKEKLETCSFKALWDTGATGSVITENVVQACQLTASGVTRVSTAAGEVDTLTYFASIFLPNKVCIPNLKVTTGVLSDDIDLLIGMDVIIRGDFAINNMGGITSFSFRIPSMERVDFTGSLEKQQLPEHPNATPNIAKKKTSRGRRGRK